MGHSARGSGRELHGGDAGAGGGARKICRLELPAGLDLGRGIQHVIYVVWDNTHLLRDNRASVGPRPLPQLGCCASRCLLTGPAHAEDRPQRW